MSISHTCTVFFKKVVFISCLFYYLNHYIKLELSVCLVHLYSRDVTQIEILT